MVNAVKSLACSDQNIANSLSFYNILFLQIIEQCFNPENNSIRQITAKLSNELLNRCQYQSLTKVRTKYKSEVLKDI